EGAGLMGRLAEGEDRAVAFRACVVAGDRAAGNLELLGVVAGQIRADRLPARAVVERAMDVLGAGVERVWVMGRPLDREGPLEAVALHFGPRAHAVRLRPNGDVADLPGARVPAEQTA